MPLRRLLVAGILSLPLAALLAQANPIDDCNQSADLKKQIDGCTLFLQLNPFSPHVALAYGRRAVAYVHKGDLARAIADFDQAIRIDPRQARFLVGRGLAYRERGVSFGYNTLVSDMRALPILAETGAPVIFDATHSVQQPGGQGAQSGGERRFVPVLARAAVAVGVAGVFIETHQDPDRAPSDGPNMVPLKELPSLLAELMAIDRLVKKRA